MSSGNIQNQQVMERFRLIARNMKQSEESKGKSMQVKSIKKNINDIFKWLIWFNKISKDAMLCPYCSKLWWHSCISKWLLERKSEWPHCRNSLTTRQLVNWRFVSDISDAINDLNDVGGLEVNEENCEEHNTELKYFCKTCNTPICSDWAMFGTKHKDHKFEKLMDVYLLHLSKIKREKRGSWW